MKCTWSINLSQTLTINLSQTSKIPIKWKLSALVNLWSKALWNPEVPPEFVLTQSSFPHWPRTLPVLQCYTQYSTSASPALIPSPTHHTLIPISKSHISLHPPWIVPLHHWMFNHYSYLLPITTVFWKMTSPTTLHSHIALISSFIVYPHASNLLTLFIGFKNFPYLPKKAKNNFRCIRDSNNSQGFLPMISRSMKAPMRPWKTILNSTNSTMCVRSLKYSLS